MEKALRELGFILVSAKVHANEYRFDEIVLYTIPAKQLNLVISPEDYLYVKRFECKKFHNSNLLAFPKELNKGEREIHYGYKLVFDNE